MRSSTVTQNFVSMSCNTHHNFSAWRLYFKLMVFIVKSIDIWFGVISYRQTAIYTAEAAKRYYLYSLLHVFLLLFLSLNILNNPFGLPFPCNHFDTELNNRNQRIKFKSKSLIFDSFTFTLTYVHTHTHTLQWWN